MQKPKILNSVLNYLFDTNTCVYTGETNVIRDNIIYVLFVIFSYENQPTAETTMSFFRHMYLSR